MITTVVFQKLVRGESFDWFRKNGLSRDYQGHDTTEMWDRRRHSGHG